MRSLGLFGVGAARRDRMLQTQEWRQTVRTSVEHLQARPGMTDYAGERYMKRPYVYFIRGRQHEWAVNFDLKPEHAADMRADGIGLGEVRYGIPAWVVYAGLSRAWMFATDIFHFRNPFAK